MPQIPRVDVGSPVSDNALSVIAEGRAGYTIGPGMLFSAPGLHPVLGMMY
ncbi:hypothetical protein ACFQ3C_11105 [Seohaeicola saemankumensis]|uniref:Uncharacterized protein n=1 Tax=Seohaeicola saemankumensis TaxID=481181 RepID=A0ABW3TER8_9RHOB